MPICALSSISSIRTSYLGIVKYPETCIIQPCPNTTYQTAKWSRLPAFQCPWGPTLDLTLLQPARGQSAPSEAQDLAAPCRRT